MSEGHTLDKTYDPGAVEAAIYELWLASGAVSAAPDARPRDRRYVIMMPLPNVTGALHMGHAMDNVMQDLLVRWHRMMGDNTLWMPGTDHAGIATQAVVEKRLKELEGKTRHDIGRDGLVKRIWEWKDQYQSRIIAQQQRMGCSCDWQRQRFTMDAVCARAVRHAFFRMFGDGLIHRGKRLVNWDVQLQTSVSDDEVYHETTQGFFWHLRYPVIDPEPGEPDAVVVATTRPETMLGDTAVAVHPDPEGALDAALRRVEQSLATANERERTGLEEERRELEERKATLLPGLEKLRDMARAGRLVRLPLLDRPMPLICDAWAKPELGSGCVKVTPAHDVNDHAVWTRHQTRIDIVNILNADGTLNQAAGPYAGLDRYAARERVVADLEKLGLMAEVEEREVEIGHSDRSKTPIEPFLSDQWFIHMGDVDGGINMGRGTAKEHSSPGLVQAAIDAVTSERVRIHPERYTKTYLDWLAEKRDWPISRQLWWGHRFPVWSKELGWSEVDLDDLTPIATALGERAVACIHLPDQGASVALVRSAEGRLIRDPRSTPGDTEPGPTERCTIDVCLLGDDADLIDALEAAGYARESDVLDTWFSSALWPFSTLGWPDPETAEVEAGKPGLGARDGHDTCLDYFYPGSCLVTGRDIITLWVARMVLAGLYTLGDVPFSDVFIHANILDGKGERMSKTKGNGIDPVDIIDTYGTDAMRYVLCDMQTGTQDMRLPVTAICPRCDHHNDLATTKTGRSIFIRVCTKCDGEFDVLGTIEELPAGKLISERFEVGRAFCTKLWNSARFALMNLAGAPIGSEDLAPEQLEIEDRWILDGLNQTVAAVERALEQYNPSTALGAAREFFWGSFCDWYLELIKPRLNSGDTASAQVARRVLAYVLDQVLRLLHPFVPFITEYLWQQLGRMVSGRTLGDFATVDAADALIGAGWPRFNAKLEDAELRHTFAQLQEVTRGVRDVRVSAGVPPRQQVRVTLKASSPRARGLEQHAHVIQHLAGVETLRFDAGAQREPGSAVKVLDDLQIFVHEVIDDENERKRLEKQREKLEKMIVSAEKRLQDSNFTDKAPAEVVAQQRERLATNRASLEAIERSYQELS